MVMGRNCYCPILTWADFVMGRNDPESLGRVFCVPSFLCAEFEWVEFAMGRVCYGPSLSCA